MKTWAARRATSLLYLCLCTVGLLSGCSNKHLVSISVTPQSPSVSEVGQTIQFQAIGTTNNTRATPRDLTSTATWSSSTPSIATIDSSGMATATGCGQTSITAQDSGIVGATELTVTC